MITGQLTKNGISAYDSGGGSGSSKNMAMLIVGMQGNVEASEVDYLCDGVDDHIQINQAIQDAAPGTTILILQGIYKLGASIDLSKSDMTIRGVPLVPDKDYDYKTNLNLFTSLTIMDGVSIDNISMRAGMKNILISNLVIIANKAGINALYPNIVSDIEIKNIVFFDTYTTISSANTHININMTKNVRIKNCLSKTLDAQNYIISVTGSSDNSSTNLTIRDNIVIGETTSYGKYSILVNRVSNVNIENNVLSKIELRSGNTAVVNNNTITKSSSDTSNALTMNAFSDCIIMNNTIDGAIDKLDTDVFSYSGCGISSSHKNIVANNFIKKTSRGIIPYGEDNIIIGNHIKYTNVGIGPLYSHLAQDNGVYSSNIIVDYKEKGIDVSAENIIVTSNNISVNTDFTIPSTSYAIWTSDQKQLISDNICSFKDAWVSNAYSLYIRSAYSLVSYNNIYGKNYNGSGASITYSNNKYN